MTFGASNQERRHVIPYTWSYDNSQYLAGQEIFCDMLLQHSSGPDKVSCLFRDGAPAPPTPTAPGTRRHAPSGGHAAVPGLEACAACTRERPRQRCQVRGGSGGDRGGEDHPAAGRTVNSFFNSILPFFLRLIGDKVSSFQTQLILSNVRVQPAKGILPSTNATPPLSPPKIFASMRARFTQPPFLKFASRKEEKGRESHSGGQDWGRERERERVNRD